MSACPTPPACHEILVAKAKEPIPKSKLRYLFCLFMLYKAKLQSSLLLLTFILKIIRIVLIYLSFVASKVA